MAYYHSFTYSPTPVFSFAPTPCYSYVVPTPSPDPFFVPTNLLAFGIVCTLVSFVMTAGIIAAIVMHYRKKSQDRTGFGFEMDIVPMSNVTSDNTPVQNPEVQVQGAEIVKRGCHLPSAIFTFLLGGFCLAMSVLFLLAFTQVDVVDEWLVEPFGIVFILLYLCYISESVCCTKTRRYLTNLMVDTTIYSHVQAVRQTPPRVSFHNECYHYETRTRLVTQTVNGRTTTRTETYQVKIVTHAAHEEVPLSQWADASQNLSGLERFALAKVKFGKQYAFGDTQSQAVHQALWASFVARNHRDTHQHNWETMDVPGFQDVAMFLIDVRLQPWLLRWWAYALAVVFFLGWTYRCWLSSRSAKFRYTYVKTIYLGSTPGIMVPVVVMPMVAMPTPGLPMMMAPPQTMMVVS